jgi:carbonic anhydrase
LAGESIAGRWVPIIDGGARAIYLDTAGLVREGSQVRTWVREVYLQEQRSDHIGVYYFSANSLVDYDCDRRTWVPLTKVFFGGDGTELRRVNLEAVEVPALATPGSLQEGLLERACRPPGKPVKQDEALKAARPAKVALAETGTKADSASTGSEAGKPASADKDSANGETGAAAAAAKKAAADVKQPSNAAAPVKPEVKAVPKPAVSDAPRPITAVHPYARPPAPSPMPVNAYQTPRARGYRGDKFGPGAQTKPPMQEEVHWSYQGAGAPEKWGKLNADNAACASGKRQSPIDIRDGAKLELEPIKFDYKPSPLHVIDNGHTVQINYAEGSSISLGGERYELKQFHFHRPSEERVDGRMYDMVAHLVHASSDGRLAVLAVLFETGSQPNAFIRALWPHLPLEQGREVSPADVQIDVNSLLPELRTYYAYMGSLTTPPCTEGVLWLVMKTPVQLTQDQVAVFGKLYNMNARPLQSANGRLIKESM